MHNYFRKQSIIWIGLICSILIISSVKAGTILLMGIGLGTPGSGPPPVGCGGVVALQGCVTSFALGIQ